MRAVVQRVSRAEVRVGSDITGRIGDGLVVLLGVATGDTEDDADYLAQKIAGLRIFRDDEGKMNRGLKEVSGSVLVVSNFTVLGDARKGNRPSWIDAAPPDAANALYERFCAKLAAQGVPVAKGVFRAMMEVDLVNDGPVTLVVDTAKP